MWTADQLAAFLDSVRLNRLYALWRLAALRGLRRGKLAVLRWADLDLNHQTTGHRPRKDHRRLPSFRGPTESSGQHAHHCLDRHTVAVLRQHVRHQRQERNTAGNRCTDTCSPTATATRYIPGTSPTASLPWWPQPDCPRCLHDLRHGAATLAHLAGTNLRPPFPISPATPASCSPPTPTPACHPQLSTKLPNPPPGSCSTLPATTTTRSPLWRGESG